MNDTKRKNVIFTKEELDDVFRILECSAISLIDIRHNLISSKEALKNYTLPCSAYLFTSGGKAEILLEDNSYSVNHFGLFHGGKGTNLSILPYCDWLEYYMILYKTGETQFHKEQLHKLLKRINPYDKRYGFAPENPVFITDLLRSMYEQWHHPSALEKFCEKSLFYRLILELYIELAKENVLTFQPDIVGMAIRYMEQNYASPITVQDMCERLGISYSHFYRLFKKETGIYPQGYLTNIRLEKSKFYIQNSNYSLSEIAKFTGFYDEFHLSSTFKKLTGISPINLRKNLTWETKYTYMETFRPFPYNRVSYDKLNLEGAYFMLKQFTNKTVIAAALSLMILFSACATPTSISSGDNSTPNQTTAEQTSDTSDEASTETETRVIRTKMGDVEVPSNPKRVITDCGLIGDVVALGVIPIAIEDYTSTDVAYQDLIKDSKVLEKWEPEYIMAEEPDLILTIYEENYEQLSEIAPTVYVPSNELTVEEELSFLADALGKDPAEGKQLVTSFQEKAAEWKTKLEAAGLYDKTFSVIRVQGENKIGVRWSNNLGGQILFGALDLPKTESALKEIEAGQDWGDTLSFESLPEYMGDYILVTEYNNNYESIVNNPIWQSLPAVQNGNIIVLSEAYMYLNDIYSWSAQLDLVGNALLELTQEK